MSRAAITALGLSKRYRIPALRTDDSSADRSGSFHRLRGSIQSRAQADTWIDAVEDVSFRIDAGEAVGLIGRNGAGKSTLLKLLSRVTRPTSGHADVYGRVGALLEVGTGFHPELTGRENTFLSGAILGMSRRDITARFDEIVAFAEIAPFIDMPVKHYSSGMYARLGFAVAAFLRPDILFVDEILAVGDLGFQAKCLAHMRNLTKVGTTVLFVSHNLLGMADLCPRALVMADGRLSYDGETAEAINVYRSTFAVSTGPAIERGHLLRINGREGLITVEANPNDEMRIELLIDEPVGAIRGEIELNVVIESSDGRKAIHLRNDSDGTKLNLGPGSNVLTVDIEDLSLVPGHYILWLRVVRLSADPPTIWDTERLHLVIRGDQRWESTVQPRYHFGQLD